MHAGVGGDVDRVRGPGERGEALAQVGEALVRLHVEGGGAAHEFDAEFLRGLLDGGEGYVRAAFRRILVGYAEFFEFADVVENRDLPLVAGGLQLGVDVIEPRVLD